MTIDYKKAFEKLVEQIKTEYAWAEEAEEKARSGRDCGKPTLKECRNSNVNELDARLNDFGRARYNRGMMFAYMSIKDLAEQLEEGKFDFDDDSSKDEL